MFTVVENPNFTFAVVGDDGVAVASYGDPRKAERECAARNDGTYEEGNTIHVVASLADAVVVNED